MTIKKYWPLAIAGAALLLAGKNRKYLTKMLSSPGAQTFIKSMVLGNLLKKR